MEFESVIIENNSDTRRTLNLSAAEYDLMLKMVTIALFEFKRYNKSLEALDRIWTRSLIQYVTKQSKNAYFQYSGDPLTRKRIIESAKKSFLFYDLQEEKKLSESDIKYAELFLEQLRRNMLRGANVPPITDNDRAYYLRRGEKL